jgi:hypothetical protein
MIRPFPVRFGRGDRQLIPPRRPRAGFLLPSHARGHDMVERPLTTT